MKKRHIVIIFLLLLFCIGFVGIWINCNKERNAEKAKENIIDVFVDIETQVYKHVDNDFTDSYYSLSNGTIVIVDEGAEEIVLVIAGTEQWGIFEFYYEKRPFVKNVRIYSATISYYSRKHNTLIEMTYRDDDNVSYHQSSYSVIEFAEVISKLTIKELEEIAGEFLRTQ